LTLSPNAEWVLQAFERWNAGDRTPPLERFDPEIEVSTVIGNAFAGEPGSSSISRSRGWPGFAATSCSACTPTSTVRKRSPRVD
jgi:hypothetical protein